MLPPRYEIEDYESCFRNHNYYCKLGATLKIPSNNYHLIQQVNETSSNNDRFDRTLIYRAMCLSVPQIPDEIQLTNRLNQKMESFNLTATIDYHNCYNGETSITLYDNMVLYSFLAYLTFVLYATYYEVISKSKTSGTGSILQHFSLLNSWKNRTNVSKSVDNEKLLSMQGLRFYTMLSIIFMHVFINYSFLYVTNPEDLEKLLKIPPLMRPLSNIGNFVVLSFFVMSSWLLTLQTSNHIQKHGILTIKDFSIIVLNRYFRFSTAIFLMFVWSSNWILKAAGPLNFDMVINCVQSCQNGWLFNIFYINNFFHMFQVCNPVTWSLSADFQMYLINIFIVYTVLKYKLNEYKVYGLALLFSCILYGTVLYYYNINVIWRANVRNIELKYLHQSIDFLMAYISTISISSSSFIGIIMGKIYFKNKNKTFQVTQFRQMIWLLLFIGLPCFSLVISVPEYGRLEAAIVGAIVKPIYSLGFGIGILGMSHNMGGIIKKFFESKYAVFLSNYSFSIYLSHLILVFQTFRYVQPTFTIITWLINFAVIAVVSIACGIFITLVVEEPCLSLQKKLLPQIKKYQKVT